MITNLKLLLASLLLMLVGAPLHAADLVDGTAYYLVNDFYGKLLGQNEAGDAPSLSVEGKNGDPDSYIFVAEKSGTSGYVYLRQKSSGRYLAASGSNAYSVVFESARQAQDRFLWQLTTGLKTRITNRKNTGKRLGCDWNNTTYEGVYYDKSAGVMNYWSVIPMVQDAQHDYQNARGTLERVYYALGDEQVTLDTPVDMHIYREDKPITTGSINITDARAWVIFDNCTPTNVKTNYLSKIRVNGTRAAVGTNVRIAIYLNGAAVIPCKSADVALTGYTDVNYGGDAIELKNGNTKDLKQHANAIRSFRLRRGYMATLCTNRDGRGYTRVYVADHADVEVADLPEALDQRISSIHIKPWQYTGKKGFGGGSDRAYKLRCGWNYNWDANSTSSIDVEYIPIRQHKYWPSMSDVNGKEASTATLSINEPEHGEQHQGCSCGGTVDEWTACTLTPDFLPSGSRIGSPAPTDQGWLKNYFGHITDMAYRCDFAVTHGYWGPNQANGTSGWNSRINSIYNDTKRPLWITEWEYGSSWEYNNSGIYNGTVTEMARKTLEILDALETNDHLERYAYYNTDGVWKLHCWYDDGSITPVGEAYRYVKSDFAYKASQQAVPNYWTPGTSTPSVSSISLADGAYSITVHNANGDFTGSLTLQAQTPDGQWTDVYSVTDRSLYDEADLRLTIPVDEAIPYTTWRVQLTTLAGRSVTSPESPFYASLQAMPNLAFDLGPYVQTGIATYDKDRNATLTLSGMQPVQGWSIRENGDARACGQMQWGSSYAIGNADYTMPATDSQGNTEGGGLAMVAVWTASAEYFTTVQLQPGRYHITIPVYNIGKGTDIEANLTGIVLSNGLKPHATATTYPVGQWTTEQFDFTLTRPATATISLGYTARNVGSGTSPHLVYDAVQVEYTDPDALAVRDMDAAVQSSPLYDLSGRRVLQPRRGLYIRQGRPVIIH